MDPEAILVVVRTVIPPTAHPLDRHTPLLSSGVVDSFAVAELALALSTAFDVEVPLEALAVDNADTAEQIASLLSDLL